MDRKVFKFVCACSIAGIICAIILLIVYGFNLLSLLGLLYIIPAIVYILAVTKERRLK